MGSAALGLAYVASGRLDIYFHHNLYPWDITSNVDMRVPAIISEKDVMLRVSDYWDIGVVRNENELARVLDLPDNLMDGLRDVFIIKVVLWLINK